MGKLLFIFCLSASVILSGCSSNTETSSATPTPTLAAPTIVEFGITCLNEDMTRTEKYSNFSDAWVENFEKCDAEQISGTILSGQQQRALELSQYSDPKSLKILYQLCAQTRGSSFQQDFLNEGTAAEFAGMLTICPEHPLAQNLMERIAQYNFWVNNGSEKTGFGPGLYLVGTDIAAGTYRTISGVKDCYWERQDSKGRTIENDYILAAPSVEITIAPTDTSFLTEGCSFFELVQ